MPDLFTIAKNEARKVYKELNPSSLEEYTAYLADAMDKAAPAFTEKQIEAQAKKTASWWWTNVFHKNDQPVEESEEAIAQKKQSAAGMLMLLKNFGGCIIDTETTGLRNDDRIIELSIIDMEGSILFTSLFDPGIRLPEKITEITGITDGMLWGQPTFASRAAEISALLKRYIITGWNVPFDVRMLANEFARTSVTFDDSNTHDLMPLCAKVLGHGNGYLKLLKAKEELRIGENQEHRSLADCLDTLAVLNATIRRIQEGDRQPDLPFQAEDEAGES